MPQRNGTIESVKEVTKLKSEEKKKASCDRSENSELKDIVLKVPESWGIKCDGGKKENHVGKEGTKNLDVLKDESTHEIENAEWFALVKQHLKETKDIVLNQVFHQNKRKHSIQRVIRNMDKPRKIYKVVLTGGPCGGKTTGQARLCTFFENMGWKVFRVPEAATVLLGGGVKFTELTEEQAYRFQEDLLRVMMDIENVYFRLAETIDKDVLIICDRGTMDASAFIPREKWEEIINRNGWNEVELRDNRYNQIIHVVSAANGAEPFYTIDDHVCRSESIQLARELDHKAARAWVGHPYFDVVDNSTDFESKLCRVIQVICQKLGINTTDRLQTNARKRKFLIRGPLPPAEKFPTGFQDFIVIHDYLQTNAQDKVQARLRKRGQKGYWSYTYTIRRPELQGQVVEVKTALSHRDYHNMLTQKDHNHLTVYKTRRCFLLNDQYFQLDIYQEPCHPRCKGMILLETYSTLEGKELQNRLPSFLDLVREVTGDPRYSMFNLSLKDGWANNKNFCCNFISSGSEENQNGAIVANESALTAS